MNRYRLLTANALLLAGIWYFNFACPAQAYFDISLTNYIIQVVFGFGAALSFGFSQWLSNRPKMPRRHSPAVVRARLKNGNSQNHPVPSVEHNRSVSTETVG